MVVVSFSRPDGSEIAEITVVAGQPVSSTGDISWLDWNFQPRSLALGRPVSFQEDPEEWARSLPSAYARTSIEVRVVSDSATAPSAAEPLQPPPPAPNVASFAAGPPASQSSSYTSGRPRFITEQEAFNSVTGVRRPGPGAKIVLCFVLAAYAIAILVPIVLVHNANQVNQLTIQQPTQQPFPGVQSGTVQ